MKTEIAHWKKWEPEREIGCAAQNHSKYLGGQTEAVSLDQNQHPGRGRHALTSLKDAFEVVEAGR